ncbi:MAG TPA: hypothetical protein VKR58_02725, partial [Aquella sp.]|nr:hypothetical protein [Aquella sp.]
MNKLRFCTALVLTLILGASYATKGGVCTYNSITNDNDGDRKIYKVEGKLTWTIVDGRVTFKDEHSSDSSTDSSIFFLTRMINAREGKSKKGF